MGKHPAESLTPHTPHKIKDIYIELELDKDYVTALHPRLSLRL